MECLTCQNQKTEIAPTKSKFSVFDMTIIFQGLICLSTLFTSLNPLSSVINRILMGLYMFLLLIIVLRRRNCYVVSILLISALVILLDILFTEGTFYSLNSVFYLPLWILNLLAFYTSFDLFKKALIKQKTFLIWVLVFWNISVLLSFLFLSSFRTSYGVTSFVSFCGTEHRFAATSLFCIIIGLFFYSRRKQKKFLLLIIVPIIAILLTKARTYIVVIFILGIFFMLRFIRKKSWKCILTFGALAILIIGSIYFTKLKFETDSVDYQLENRGFLYILTSGRNVFWQIDLEHFFSEDSFSIIFGKGYNYIYDVNREFYGTEIWAHNDYINVLCSNGILGLLLYFVTFFVFLNRVRSISKANVIFSFLFVSIIFFNAMFNMVYSYTIANIITPIIAMVMLDCNKKHVTNNSISNKHEFINY